MFNFLVEPEVARALASLPNRLNEMGYDPWGFNREEAAVLYSIARRVYSYFRPVIHGIEHLPAGRVLVVPNHSGQVAFDGVVIAVACLLHASPPRLVRGMVERWLPKLPFVNEALARGGAVLGNPINCKNLLEDDQAILVFPEGARGSGKTWFERYQLKSFGRGFMRLALQTKTPIVPVAVIGGEESIVSVHDWKTLARLLKMPYVPISPLLPLLGPLAYLPLPVRFHVYFGEALHFTGAHDDEDAALDEKVAVVTGAIRRMLDDGLAARQSIF